MTEGCVSPLIKILRLESYEDALHNLVTEETLEREANRADAVRRVEGNDRYRLRYLARLPLEAGTSLLAVDKLAHPFRYEIEVLTKEGPELRTVDLVETFNLAYGLRVKRMASWVNPEDDRTYRVVVGTDREGGSTLVLWRDMEALDPATERSFLEDAIADEDGAPFDTVLINGDSTVPGVRSLDPIFKTLIDEEER